MKPVELLAVKGGLDIKLFEDGSGVMRVQVVLHHEGRDAPPRVVVHQALMNRV